MNGIADAINLTAIIIATIALITSLAALILVVAQRLSTHKIEWKPLVTEAQVEEVEENETADEDFLQDALRLNKKKKKEEDPLSENETTNF